MLVYLIEMPYNKENKLLLIWHALNALCFENLYHK